MERSEEEQAAFIERFALEREAKKLPDGDDFTEEELELARVRKSSTFFWSLMLVLGLCPFVLSGGLLYILGRYEQLIGAGGLEVLSKTLTPEEAEAMSSDTGIQELQFFLNVYENRHLIIALIFTGFFALIALLVIARGLIITYRGRTYGEEED